MAVDTASVQDYALLVALGVLTDRQRQVIHGRFWWGETIPQVARRLGLSEARVAQIQRVALERMRAEMDGYVEP